MQSPTLADIRDNPDVQQALEEAWIDSLPEDASRQHEEGGWIYFEVATGAVIVRRSSRGEQALLDLSHPPILSGAVIVATFHTHPNPGRDGWDTGPSAADTRSAWVLGVPCLIRAEDRTHTTGPEARRGGLTGDPGFPR